MSKRFAGSDAYILYGRHFNFFDIIDQGLKLADFNCFGLKLV